LSQEQAEGAARGRQRNGAAGDAGLCKLKGAKSSRPERGGEDVPGVNEARLREIVAEGGKANGKAGTDTEAAN